MIIPFNFTSLVGKELEYISQAVSNQKTCGNGKFTQKCQMFLEETTKTKKALLTTSCTHALEMAAFLCEIKAGDEVIMPSYTFVSTANAFALRGAKIIFVDIRPDTMNINENLIEPAITSKTKVIVPVHYAGVACDMNKIMEIARKYNLFVVEDAAQAMMSTYCGKPLGTIGDFGCYSFHETKNFTCGEGGAILINNQDYVERAQIIRENGTNRNNFFKGLVDKYTWIDEGSSYLPSEITAAWLYAQLEIVQTILSSRLHSYNMYRELLSQLINNRTIDVQYVPDGCQHNASMFYIKCKDVDERTQFITYMKNKGIVTLFHYVPLHTSPRSSAVSTFSGDDCYTTNESDRLVRLPLYYNMKESDIKYITQTIKNFF